MIEMLKWGVAAMLLTLFATAQASADGDAGRGKTLFTRCSLTELFTSAVFESMKHGLWSMRTRPAA